MGLDQEFLELLTHVITWESHLGQDKWGNNTYTPSRVIACFVTEITQAAPGPESQNRQKTKSLTYEAITDAHGIKVGDRISIDGNPCWVTNATTNRDESGDVVQTLIIETQEDS